VQPAASVSLPQAQRSNSDLPRTPQVASYTRPSAMSTGMSKQKQMEELNNAVDMMNKEIFDLSVTPSLIDPREYETRLQKYKEAVSKMPPQSDSKPVSVISPPNGTDLASQFAKASFIPGAKAPEISRNALSSILGKGPIATENDLVAFFSLKPSTVPTTTQ
jgi:hypothetical protein